MKYVLYVITNTVNGKTYAGITGRAVSKRLNEHFCAAKMGTHDGHIVRAIRKHGRENFEIREICKYLTREEATSAEIDYIKDYKPEYNSTLGGDGRLGGYMTDEGKQKIIATHTGNKYRLGIKHTPEVVSLLTKLGHKNKNIFKSYSHLGPEASSKKVICLDDWLVFPSASEAARRYNVAKSAIIELCLGKRGRKTVGGFRFAYADGAF